MSLTNTDPTKTDRFPKFDWPRIDVPGDRRSRSTSTSPRSRPPRRARSSRPARRSRRTRTTSPASSPSRSRARAATTTCGRSSCRRCRRSCHDYDALFVLDEVQTGVGTDRHAVGLPAARPRARHRRVRQEGAARRHHGRPPGRRGARQRLPRLQPDQLHLGRRAGRHGALPADPGDHRGRRAVRARGQGGRRFLRGLHELGRPLPGRSCPTSAAAA